MLRANLTYLFELKLSFVQSGLSLNFYILITFIVKWVQFNGELAAAEKQLWAFVSQIVVQLGWRSGESKNILLLISFYKLYREIVSDHPIAFSLSFASSICPDKNFFVLDKTEIVHDKNFVQS